jgi:Protein of unknown function DUF2625
MKHCCNKMQKIDMSTLTEQLAKLGSDPLSLAPATFENDMQMSEECNINALQSMLSIKNGFYAFESALHVFPAASTLTEWGLSEWNANVLWRYAYKGKTDGALFFAEDIFGVQFALQGEAVFTFDPEVGEFEFFANSLEEWAAQLLQSYELHTGFPLAHEWQIQNGKLPSSHRLLPKIPFCLGGEFRVENLYSLNSTKGMLLRAEIAMQLKDSSEGTSVKLKIVG